MAVDLAAIRQAVSSGNYRYTNHAVQRTTERHISRTEIEEAIGRAEVIEEYPDDKYSPSCLLYGATHQSRPLHIQVSYPSVKIITAYEPDPNEWEDNRKRKTHE